jgi:EAL and modified HD-GYP domain-containing signal transduction protein
VGRVETLVGRQPIFDRDLTVRGYELLFRDLETPATVTEGDERYLTAESLLSSAADAIDTLVGAKRAFCNVSRSIISADTHMAVAPDRVVLEIDAVQTTAPRAAPTDLAGYRRLRDDGYTLAVDDLRAVDGVEDLLELVSIVKIDTEAVDRDVLPELVAACRRFNVEVIALGVDTPATLGRCEALGFDYFQGFLLARRHAAPSGPLAPGRLAGLRVSARLLDAECPITVIEDIIRGDPAMSHQLLQLAGAGAAGGMKRTVRTLRQALVLVGWRRLQSWLALLLLTEDGGSTSEEEIAIVLMRARMAESLAAAAGCRPDSGYTAGLLSALDIVLGLPVEKIIETLPLDTELRDAVLNAEGSLGQLIADVADYQLGRSSEARRTALSEDTLRAAAVEALTWTVGMTAVLDPGEPA